MLCLGGLPLRNGLVTSGGAGRHANEINLRAAAEAGLRFIQVSPNRADVPDWCNAEWIPIRPGTDTALLLAMAHVIVTRGQAGSTPSSRRHCVGWDRLRAYITGRDRRHAEDARLGRADHHHPGRYASARLALELRRPRRPC